MSALLKSVAALALVWMLIMMTVPLAYVAFMVWAFTTGALH